MNFQAVEQANGNRIIMCGVFVEIGGLQWTPQQKAKAICKIRDDTGATHNVHIYKGKGELPGPAQANQKHQFSLSTFQGTSQRGPYTGYSGFWQQPQGQQQTSQNAQQGPQNAPQPVNGLQETYNTLEEQSIRQSVVCAYIPNGEPDIQTVKYWVEYIKTGKAPLPPQRQQTEPDAPESDNIPWET